MHQASELFRDMGYSNATMDKIAKVSGIAKPTLYHYFTSKEEILFNIHLLYILPLIESQQTRIKNNLSSTRISYEIIFEHLMVIVQSPGMLQSFIENHRELNADRKLKMRNNRKKYRELVRTSFQQDVDSGVIAPCDTRVVTFSLFGVCNWASRAHLNLSIDEVHGLALELWRTFAFGTHSSDRHKMYPDDFA